MPDGHYTFFHIIVKLCRLARCQKRVGTELAYIPSNKQNNKQMKTLKVITAAAIIALTGATFSTVQAGTPQAATSTSTQKSSSSTKTTPAKKAAKGKKSTTATKSSSSATKSTTTPAAK